MSFDILCWHDPAGPARPAPPAFAPVLKYFWNEVGGDSLAVIRPWVNVLKLFFLRRNVLEK